MTESNRIEYKQELTDSLEKEVIAFLNYREGGVIYLGIDKDGIVEGLQDSDSVQLKIKDRLKNNIQPSCLGLFDVVNEQREGKDIIKLIIAGGYDFPFEQDYLDSLSSGQIGGQIEDLTDRQKKVLRGVLKIKHLYIS